MIFLFYLNKIYTLDWGYSTVVETLGLIPCIGRKKGREGKEGGEERKGVRGGMKGNIS
jgi:hypothetical protein